jgi:LysM repeat protein
LGFARDRQGGTLATLMVARSVTLLVLMFAVSTAYASDREPLVHTVYAGQRLGSIAKRYRVSIEAICNANGIRRADIIRPGQELIIPQQSDPDGSKAPKHARPPSRSDAKSSPGHGEAPSDTQHALTHTVHPGQRLGSIAKRYHVSVAALCEANGIRRTDIIKPGQELTIPGHDAPSPRTPAKKKVSARNKPRSWTPYVKPAWHKGYVHVVGHHNSWKGYLTGAKRRVLPAGRRAVSRVMAWPRKDRLIDRRLLSLLSQVSDTFGGRTLRIVSGWRMTSFARESRHKLGRAVGVSNEALRDYLRTCSNVGVGYYPNSTFVHLDVRDYSAYWVDYAGPGEPPCYRKPIAAAGDSGAARDSSSSAPKQEDTSQVNTSTDTEVDPEAANGTTSEPTEVDPEAANGTAPEPTGE